MSGMGVFRRQGEDQEQVWIGAGGHQGLREQGFPKRTYFGAGCKTLVEQTWLRMKTLLEEEKEEEEVEKNEEEKEQEEVNLQMIDYKEAD